MERSTVLPGIVPLVRLLISVRRRTGEIQGELRCSLCSKVKNTVSSPERRVERLAWRERIFLWVSPFRDPGRRVTFSSRHTFTKQLCTSMTRETTSGYATPPDPTTKLLCIRRNVEKLQAWMQPFAASPLHWASIQLPYVCTPRFFMLFHVPEPASWSPGQTQHSDAIYH